MNNKLKGALAAVVDGLLLAVWGVVSKALGAFDPGVSEYSWVLLVAGLGHLSLIFVPSEGDGEKSFCKYCSDKLKGGAKVSRNALPLLFIFVFISVFQFYLGVKVYEYKEADVGVSSFLRNSSLIFAALLAHFAKYFGGIFVYSRLTVRAFFGTSLFTFSVWIFFGAPLGLRSFSDLISFWVLGSIFIGFNRSLTELLMQRFSRAVKREEMNFVVGCGLLVVGLVGLAASRSELRGNFLLYFLIAGVGLIIPAMQAFRYTALKYLNEVLGKKGYTIWTYLASSMLMGGVFFYEPLTLFKWSGLLLGAIAVPFLDKGTYEEVLMPFRKRIGR